MSYKNADQIRSKVLSKSKRRSIERDFNAKCDARVFDGQLAEAYGRALKKLHDYRNEAYHGDEVRPPTINQRDAHLRLLGLQYDGNASCARNELRCSCRLLRYQQIHGRRAAGSRLPVQSPGPDRTADVGHGGHWRLHGPGSDIGVPHRVSCRGNGIVTRFRG